MTSRTTKSLKIDDLYRLPDNGLKHGLSRGHLVSEPPPGALHGRLAANLVYALQSYARTHDGGIVLTCDTWFVLARGPDTVRGPDVAYVTHERYAEVTDEFKPFVGPPDIAIEVLSPRDREKDVQTKLKDFLDGGTPLVWIVDPRAQQVRVCSRDGTIVLTLKDMLTAPSLLPGFELPVREVFG